MEVILDGPYQVEESATRRTPDGRKQGATKRRNDQLQPFRIDTNLCTSGQAAKLLGIPDRTVRRYLRKGKIAGIQNPITGRWQIPHEALVRFVRERGCDLRQFPFSVHALVVDNEPALANAITRILDKSFPDAVVNVARDACNALIEIGNMKPDLVILDGHMPTLDGREILIAMKNNPVTKAIKVLTICVLVEDLHEMRTLGADETLFKPFSLNELVEKVEKLVPFNQITEA
jgi:excisionase family DNA binding protein